MFILSTAKCNVNIIDFTMQAKLAPGVIAQLAEHDNVVLCYPSNGSNSTITDIFM